MRRHEMMDTGKTCMSNVSTLFHFSSKATRSTVYTRHGPCILCAWHDKRDFPHQVAGWGRSDDSVWKSSSGQPHDRVFLWIIRYVCGLLHVANSKRAVKYASPRQSLSEYGTRKCILRWQGQYSSTMLTSVWRLLNLVRQTEWKASASKQKLSTRWNR